MDSGFGEGEIVNEEFFNNLGDSRDAQIKQQNAELIAALERIKDLKSKCETHEQKCMDAWIIAQEALKKARGK